MPRLQTSAALIPGLALSAAVALLSHGMTHLQHAAFGSVWLDSLVLAILLGTLLNTAGMLPQSARPGVRFSAKGPLELAIVLLGASVGAGAGIGPTMILTIAGIVLISLCVSYGLCRLLGLGDRLATLVACGNSICGNSAIMAVAPVIKAQPNEVASSIAFTAALGVVVVVILPPLFTAFGFDQWEYGVIAGMTVYAVPQVLAATAPVGALSSQIGTMVKLMRVLMLGPVILLIGLKSRVSSQAKVPLRQLLPWFILGFFAMLLARNLDLIPAPLLGPLREAATALTLVAMAALGLSVNLRTVLASGGRVLLAGVLSIIVLATLSTLALTFLPRG